jgi:integrase
MAQGSIRKRGDRYYIRTRVREVDPASGKMVWRQVERKAGTSYRKAEQQLKGLQGAIDSRRFVSERETVLQLGQRWLREHAQRNLKPSTAANYKGVFYAHVAPALGAFRVDEVSAQMIRELLERKRAEGLSGQTVAKIRRHLHALFAFAELPVNPAGALGRQYDHKARRKSRGQALTPAEAARFLSACSERWRLFFRVALSTGLRRGELIGLRWADVSLTERVLHVRRSICPYDDLTDEDSLTTKTEAGERVVPLFPDALAALEELYRQVAAGNGGDPPLDDSPVFGTVEPKPASDRHRASVCGEPLSPRMVTRVFRRYAERAGLPEQLTLHDLRHTTVTRLIEQGASILIVSAIAGHSKTSTTTDVYGHLLRGHVQDAAARFDPMLTAHPAPAAADASTLSS